MVRVNSLFSVGIFGKYLITISGRKFKEKAGYFDHDYVVRLFTLIY